MSSAPTDCRIPDPTDKLAADQFVNRRAGYGDRLAAVEQWARCGWTLGAGEGGMLCDELDRLRDELNHARALLIDLKRYRDEAEAARPIVAAARRYLDCGGNYAEWLALRKLIPLPERESDAVDA